MEKNPETKIKNENIKISGLQPENNVCQNTSGQSEIVETDYPLPRLIKLLPFMII